MAMIRGAPAIARRARSVSGKSASGSQPSSTRHSMLARGRRLGDHASVLHAALAGRQTRSAIAPTTLPRRNAGSTLAPAASAAQRRRRCRLRRGCSARLARPATITTLPVGELGGDRRVGAAAATALPCAAGLVLRPIRHACRVSPLRFWRELDDAAATLLRAASRSRRYRTRQLFLEIRRREHDGRRRWRPRRSWPDRSRAPPTGQAVAQLRVDVRRADDVVSRAGPRRTRPRWCRERRRCTAIARRRRRPRLRDQLGRACQRARSTWSARSSSPTRTSGAASARGCSTPRSRTGRDRTASPS